MPKPSKLVDELRQILYNFWHTSPAAYNTTARLNLEEAVQAILALQQQAVREAVIQQLKMYRANRCGCLVCDALEDDIACLQQGESNEPRMD